MTNSIYLFLIFIIFSSNTLAKDVSVFGAGDLDSSSPYGLTKAEKASLKNQEQLKSLQYKINSLQSNQDEIKEQFEGIKSVFDSDSKNLSSTKNKLKDLITNYSFLEEKITTNENQISMLSQKLDDFIITQKHNNQLLQDANVKLNEVITKINKEYVSKKQFDELVKFINSKKIKTKKKKVLNNSKNNFGFKTNAALYKYAVSLHKKLYLTKSMPMFAKLIKDNYKKASSSYYLADILHYKKKYKDAIYYYKQSMMLNDSADYIPTLLLNSAHSFEMLGDTTNARNFYQTLVEAYTQTPEAKKAQKKLDKLN